MRVCEEQGGVRYEDVVFVEEGCRFAIDKVAGGKNGGV